MTSGIDPQARPGEGGWIRTIITRLIGGGFLKQIFDPRCASPVRLHVPGQTLSVRRGARVFAILSPASVRSLDLQGGNPRRRHRSVPATSPFAADAVRVRKLTTAQDTGRADQADRDLRGTGCAARSLTGQEPPIPQRRESPARNRKPHIRDARVHLVAGQD